ncbi:MAG: MFS transporter [Okeania sp. SIO3H1]|uniref:MFS transporter n=1 Tax=Okeania sp. SIO1I7 TaxID=2607772 RepID=UPI0013CA3F3F|nr:MFS transporter [Okeania sp. SIO1I7]NEN93017.1 MFS transporter [Okeania sp. SIO3H1]NET23994.1 MFS transporter [Okeania sp. SIO1I7]
MNLTKKTIAAFVSPAIPLSALGLPLLVYLPPFYAEEMGLGLSLVGTIFMITRFWDVFTDPVLGILSDKVTTPLGRRRHWIILSVPILMICVYKVFIPEAPITGNYLLFWMLLLYVGWTLLSISHMSWGAELSSDYYERARIQGWREFALVFGMLAVLILPTILEQTGSVDGGNKVAAMGWFTIILLPITVAIAVCNVQERPVTPPPQLGLVRSTSLLLKNKLLMRVLLANIMIGLAPGIIGSIYIFFVTYAMDLGQWSSLMLLLYFIASFCGIPFWMRLSYSLEKHRTFGVAKIYGCIILTTLLLVQPGNLWLYALVNILFGIESGAGAFLLRSIMADVTDHDNLESGTQRTGLYYSLLTMTNKVGSALGVGLVYPILDLIGFVPGGTNTPAAIEALKYIFICVPIPISLIAAIAIWNFPLDSVRQQELRRLLAERDSMVGSE